MTPSSSTLDAMEPYSGNHKVLVGNGNVLPISHIGSHCLNSTLQLLDILVVPGLQKNLISISKLTRDFPVDSIFTNNSFLLQKRDTKEILAQGRREHNLYILEHGQAAFMTILNSNKLRGSFEYWHSRLGHVNYDAIFDLRKTSHLSLSSIFLNPSLYASCEQAKSKCLPFCLNDKCASHIFGLGSL